MRLYFLFPERAPGNPQPLMAGGRSENPTIKAHRLPTSTPDNPTASGIGVVRLFVDCGVGYLPRQAEQSNHEDATPLRVHLDCAPPVFRLAKMLIVLRYPRPRTYKGRKARKVRALSPSPRCRNSTLTGVPIFMDSGSRASTPSMRATMRGPSTRVTTPVQ